MEARGQVTQASRHCPCHGRHRPGAWETTGQVDSVGWSEADGKEAFSSEILALAPKDPLHHLPRLLTVSPSSLCSTSYPGPQCHLLYGGHSPWGNDS